MTTLFGFIGIIPSIIILIAAILFVSKFPGTEGYLLVGGAIVSLLVSAFYIVGLPLLTSTGDGYSSASNYFQIVSFIGTVGHVAFAVGFLMLIQKLIKARQ